MSGEASVIVAIVVLVGLGFGYVLIKIHKTRPEVARRLELLLALVQIGLVVTQCLGGQTTTGWRQQNTAATLDALRPQLNVLLLTAEAQLTRTAGWRVTLTPTPNATPTLAPTNTPAVNQSLNRNLQITAGQRPIEGTIWLYGSNTDADFARGN